MIFLERIDAVPLQGNEHLTFEIQRWMTTLVDTINTIVETIEPLLADTIVITGPTQLAESNTRYIPTDTALTSITLPAVCARGDVISIIGQGSGGWSMLTSSGQTIQLAASTAGTSIASVERYDSISVTCVVANLTWVCTNYVSTGLIIT